MYMNIHICTYVDILTYMHVYICMYVSVCIVVKSLKYQDRETNPKTKTKKYKETTKP